MSAVLQESVPKGSMSASVGIKLIRKDVTREIDPKEKEVHYVFWAGDDELPLLEANIGVPKLSRFSVTSIDNWGRWERDQDPSDTAGLRRHPDPKRAGQVWDTRGKEAGKNASWLEENYAGRGLATLKNLTGFSGEVVKNIVDSLLPFVPANTSYQEAIDTINSNRRKIATQLADLQEEVADTMISAIERANFYSLQLLETNKAEMEQRRNSGGVGKARLDRRDKRLIKLVGRTEADYTTDTRAAGEAAANQVAKAFTAIAPAIQAQVHAPTQQPTLMSMEQMQQQAMVMAMALQQLGFAPVQAQPVKQSSSTASNASSNKKTPSSTPTAKPAE